MPDDGHHSAKAFREFVEEFKRESDRAAVILGAAKLDALLYQVLQRRLVATATGTDELLDGDSPLSTFSSRINLTYRLGLITSDLARALHLIRRIRNGFAHELASCTLDSGGHRDRIRDLTAPFSNHPNFDQFRKRFFADAKGPAGDFRCVLAVVAARLEGLFEDVEPLDQKDAWSLVPPHLTEEEIKELGQG